MINSRNNFIYLYIHIILSALSQMFFCVGSDGRCHGAGHHVARLRYACRRNIPRIAISASRVTSRVAWP